MSWLKNLDTCFIDYPRAVEFIEKNTIELMINIPRNMFNSNENKLNDAKSLLLKTFTISSEKTPKQKLIINT